MDGGATFGALLRRHRERAGLSQEELAARAYVSTRAISDLERGVNARPRLHTAQALADALELHGDERVGFERHARHEPPGADHAVTVAPRARPPLAVDSFVDDGTTLAALLAAVDEPNNRLITLIGPGGVGKTRLATEVAHRLTGPVAFVALAALGDASLLAATIGNALGVEHGPTRTHLQSLVDHLGQRALTLMLDNLEQIPEAATEVAALLQACPGIRVVATSRVPLRIAGELRFPVRPLEVRRGDPAGRPGVRLFRERATASGVAGLDDEPEVAAIADLCQRLDGLPLAIELAAARAGVVAPSEMLRHLDQMLDLLRSGRSDAPTHQRSMRAALEWSVRLLPPDAQAAFAALGVFAAGASAEAAMAVWGLAPSDRPAFFDLVQVLAEAHLISVEPAPADGGLRIEMFETTRQFARDKLDEPDAADLAHTRLTAWAVDLVDRPAPSRPCSGPIRASGSTGSTASCRICGPFAGGSPRSVRRTRRTPACVWWVASSGSGTSARGGSRASPG